MTTQPPLILPGPQFKPRPGWGGRLAIWWQRNGRLAAFQIVLLLVLGIIARSVWIGTTSMDAEPSPSTSTTLSVPVYSGDNLTRVAGRALDMYLKEVGAALDAIQRLFAVTTLVAQKTGTPLGAGPILFSVSELDVLVRQANALTASQRAAWSRYLR